MVTGSRSSAVLVEISLLRRRSCERGSHLLAQKAIELSDTNTTPDRPREIVRDARALQRFSGMKYTEALRAVEHPLAQGILGERIRARTITQVLTDHPALSTSDPDSDGLITHLGRNGLWADEPFPVGLTTEHDYVSVVLAAEVLRLFDRTKSASGGSGSYGVKHTVERFFQAHLPQFGYVANGTAIHAAAVLGIPLVANPADRLDPNATFGLVAEQVAYVDRVLEDRRTKSNTVRGHHHRPAGLAFLERALDEYQATGKQPARWNGLDADPAPLTSPFHEWLIAQTGPGEFGSRALLAADYAAGLRDSDHPVARQPEDLISILRTTGAHPTVVDAGKDAVVDWARTAPQSTGVRTELSHSSQWDHEGWGAGSGDTERYEFDCPCGRGSILEEHDNTPGFREHDHRIDCETCRTEWQFVDGLPTREWRIEPLRAA